MVVTGGAGFIGSHVVDRLTRLGAEVLAIDDLSVGSEENLASATAAGARLVVGDVRDAELVKRELAGAAAVIHMACANLRSSLGDPRRAHDINATGTLTIALAAVHHGIERFVYVSSSEVYGSAVTLPMAEDHPLLPTTVYGASKAAGELYAHACMRRYGLPASVVRPFNAYGPREHATGDSAEVIPKFVLRIMTGLPPVVFGDGTQTRDFTWVGDTAAGIVAAAECDALIGEAVNVALGKAVSVGKIADHLLDILHAGDLAPELSDPRPGDVVRHWADTTKARDLLGFESEVPIREGLERYVDWLQANMDPELLAHAETVRNW